MSSRESIAMLAEGFCWLCKTPLEDLQVPAGPIFEAITKEARLTLDDGTEHVYAGPIRVRPLERWAVCPTCTRRFHIGRVVVEQIPLRPDWPGKTLTPAVRNAVIVTVDGERIGPGDVRDIPVDAEWLEIEWSMDVPMVVVEHS